MSPAPLTAASDRLRQARGGRAAEKGDELAGASFDHFVANLLYLKHRNRIGGVHEKGDGGRLGTNSCSSSSRLGASANDSRLTPADSNAPIVMTDVAVKDVGSAIVSSSSGEESPGSALWAGHGGL
jgi:hypothetical protein